jgi:hypothetical protein
VRELAVGLAVAMVGLAVIGVVLGLMTLANPFPAP